MDEIPERFDSSTGTAPSSLSLEGLAHRVLDYALQHSRPFREHGHPLLQMSGSRQSSLVSAGSMAREALGVYDARLRDADDLRARDPKGYGRAIREIESTLVRNPLPRLQGEGEDEAPFLYDWPWGPDTSPRAVRAEQSGKLEVRFIPGAPEELVRLTPLVRPLVELHFVRDVANWNGLDTVESQLVEYLFGSDRASVGSFVRRQLRLRQEGRCFYGDEHGDPQGPTNKPLVVDHFMPWSRFRSDVAENFVLATGARNRSKSDHLAHPNHVVRFLHQAEPLAGEVVAGAREGLSRTRSMISSAYRTAPLGTPMWLRATSDGPVLVPYDAAGRAAVFQALEAHPA